MAGRSKFDKFEKLEARLEDIKLIAAHLRAHVRDLSPSLVDELKTLVRHPRSLGAILEERSPWLNRRFLGVASNVVEPFLAGMGLRVERLAEDAIEVAMPGWWRNQGEGGVIHAGALSTLGEFTSRLFWEHHLDLRRSEMSVNRVELRVLAQRPTGDVKAVFRLPVAERESALYRLRAEGAAEVISQVTVYDSRERLIAEVEVGLTLARHLALGPGSGESN